MREEFKQINFRPDALRRIEQANEILADPEYRGLKLTLRQLYYQHVSKKRSSSLKSGARMARRCCG